MSTSHSDQLSAFCSGNGNYESFLTTREHINADVEFLLSQFGVAEEVRSRVHAALQNGVRFDSGFSFREEGDARVVVHASIPNSYTDKGKKPLSHHDEEFRRRAFQERMEKGRNDVTQHLEQILPPELFTQVSKYLIGNKV